MSVHEHYTIDTPENIAFSYTIAGIGSRFLAAIIDTFLLFIVQLFLVGVLFGFIHLFNVNDSNDMAMSIMLAVWGVVSFAFFWGYYIFFEMFWNGQSPGKRLIRLRVVREGGRPITFGASAIRNLIRVIDFLPSFYGLGVVVMFIDRHARRLGDFAGGTLVVKERASVSLDSLLVRAEQGAGTSVSRADMLRMAAAPGVPASAAPTIPNIHLLSNNEYDLIQEFLWRRTELGKESRERLGKQLVEKIAATLSVSVSHADREPFLEQVVGDYRKMVSDRERES